jgi:multiple sugar transport system substrate-binding protein
MSLFGRFTRRAALSLNVAALALFATGGSVLAQPVTLDFWDMPWGGADYAAAAQKLVDKFNTENPDIQVVYRSVPWTNWYETFVTALASGSAPDVSTGGGFQAVQFYSQDQILPVDDVIAEIGDDFAPGSLDAMKYDGHYVAVPWAISVKVLFYRKDVLEAAGVAVPTTQEEFRAAAKATTGNGVYGLVSSGDAGGMHWLPHIAIGNGGGLFNADGTAGLTSERSMEGLGVLAGIVADGSLNPASVGYVNNDAIGSFGRGEAAFLLGVPLTSTQIGGEAEAKIGVVPPMKGAHGDTAVLTFVNNIMAYKQTEHPEQSMKFLKWWSDNALPLWTEGKVGNLPARPSIAADGYFQDNATVKYVLDTLLPVGKTLSQAKGGTFPALNAVDGDGFLVSLTQAIWQGQQLDAAVPPANAHLEELLAGQ